MRVAIITTREEDYHKHFCAVLAARYNVVAILHPQRPLKRTGVLNLAAHKNSIAKFGLPYHILLKLGTNKVRSLGWNINADISEAEASFFPNARNEYEKISGRAREIGDINGSEGVDFLRSVGADVTVVSGGPIYRPPLLAATPVAINYHTGISPIYNGAESIFWPYVNGHPQLTGGTLMVMNSGVDAGNMLAHYLPVIEAGDTPGRLFMKTLQGGIDLYCKFLDLIAAGTPYVSAPQGRPLHYTISSEWSVHQNLILQRRVKQDVCKKFSRSQAIESIYWDRGDRNAAVAAAKEFLGKLVYGV
jgi:methionyl-tRNA formyltransferase